MRCRRESATGGFTLVEVLVAIVLVSALLAGAAGLLTLASRSIQAARMQTTATLLASQKVEEVRARPAVVQGAWQEQIGSNGELVSSAGTASGARFVRRWAVRPDGTSPQVQWVHVEVGVVGKETPLAEVDAVLSQAPGGAR